MTSPAPRHCAPLRLAVHYDAGWAELTAPGAPADEVVRLRTGSLREAARQAAQSATPVFVDIDVLLAGSVNEAFLAFTDQRPGWSPGLRAEVIVHPGTPSTLAGLLWDIWAARVADGVTLHATDPHALTARLLDEVVPLLARRGLNVDVGTPSAA